MQFLWEILKIFKIIIQAIITRRKNDASKRSLHFLIKLSLQKLLFFYIVHLPSITLKGTPFRLARNTFQCSFISAGTLAETFAEEEATMIGAQETLGLSGSHRGLSGGVKDVSSREDSFVSNRLNSSLCCFATAPLRTLCLRREHGIVDVLTTGSSDK